MNYNEAQETANKHFFPMEGVEIWRNPKNKFTVFQLHYSADPAKKTKEWKENAKCGIPRREWMREYELAWDSWAGMPVYDEFDQKIHGVQGDIDPELGLPLLRGWDFGLTPSVIIAQLVEEQLRVMYEFTAVNMGIERFSELVLLKLAVLYPAWSDQKKDFKDYIDPSGFARKDTDETTCAKVMMKKGISPVGGPIPFLERRDAVTHFLTRHANRQPCFQVSIPNCPVLVRGFKGGYMYPEKTLDIEPTVLKPLKNEYSHPHDGLQMLAGRVILVKRKSGIVLRSPHYNWMK